MSETTEQEARDGLGMRLLKMIGGLTMVGIGGAIAVFMSISVILETMMDDFFGMCVAGMVAFFGAMLVRDGVFLIMGWKRNRELATPSVHHRKGYARAAGYPHGMPADPTRCAAAIHDGWQCPNPRTSGPSRAFCGKHARQHEAAS